MATDDFKNCPQCKVTVGAWRPTCDCGWQFDSDGNGDTDLNPLGVRVVVNPRLPNEVSRARADDERLLFKKALSEYRKTDLWSPLADDDDRMVFIRDLMFRYRHQKIIVVVWWSLIATVTFYLFGQRAWWICGFQVSCWLAYTVRRAQGLERQLIDCCSNLRLNGESFLANQIESLYPLLRFSPKVADEVLARFSGNNDAKR